MLPASDPIIYVIDDDATASQAVVELVRTLRYEVREFSRSDQFFASLSVVSEPFGCVIADLHLEGVDAAACLLQRLNDRYATLPAIFMTSRADTAATVRALRGGAVAVLEQPFRDDELWSFIQEAISRSDGAIDLQRRRSDLESRFKRLSSPDRQVLQLMLEGLRNQVMAQRLGVSLRTIENRRRRVFETMQAGSVAELTRLVVEYEYNLPPTPPATKEGWLHLPFQRTA